MHAENVDHWKTRRFGGALGRTTGTSEGNRWSTATTPASICAPHSRPGAGMMGLGIPQHRVRLQWNSLGLVVGHKALGICAHAEVKLHLRWRVLQRLGRF